MWWGFTSEPRARRQGARNESLTVRSAFVLKRRQTTSQGTAFVWSYVAVPAVGHRRSGERRGQTEVLPSLRHPSLWLPKRPQTAKLRRDLRWNVCLPLPGLRQTAARRFYDVIGSRDLVRGRLLNTSVKNAFQVPKHFLDVPPPSCELHEGRHRSVWRSAVLRRSCPFGMDDCEGLQARRSFSCIALSATSGNSSGICWVPRTVWHAILRRFCALLRLYFGVPQWKGYK